MAARLDPDARPHDPRSNPTTDALPNWNVRAHDDRLSRRQFRYLLTRARLTLVATQRGRLCDIVLLVFRANSTAARMPTSRPRTTAAGIGAAPAGARPAGASLPRCVAATACAPRCAADNRASLPAWSATATGVS
jgi:hypothetical protein